MDNTNNNETLNLEALKQKAIEETIEEYNKWKNILYAEIQKTILNRYLTKDWKRRENIEDSFLERISWNIITDDVKKFREDLDKVHNETELERIKTDVIKSINNQEINKDTTKDTTTTEHYELNEFNINVPEEYKELHNQLIWEEKPDLEAFACAVKCYEEQKSSLHNTKYLIVIDFTKPNTENRLYVINMDNKSVENATTVWHWQWSWRWRFATSFSNIRGSNQSSLWFFKISQSYENNTKKTRKWLRMYPTSEDKKNNGNAASRWIFLHPWTKFSQWCFTIPEDNAQEIMEKVKGWGLFAYAKSKDYFVKSEYFNTNSSWDVLLAA